MIALILVVAMFSMFDPVLAGVTSVVLVTSMVIAYSIAFRRGKPSNRLEWACGIYVLVLIAGGADMGH